MKKSRAVARPPQGLVALPELLDTAVPEALRLIKLWEPICFLNWDSYKPKWTQMH